jgi:hypothetical protein
LYNERTKRLIVGHRFIVHVPSGIERWRSSPASGKMKTATQCRKPNQAGLGNQHDPRWNWLRWSRVCFPEGKVRDERGPCFPVDGANETGRRHPQARRYQGG